MLLPGTCSVANDLVRPVRVTTLNVSETGFMYGVIYLITLAPTAGPQAKARLFAPVRHMEVEVRLLRLLAC